MPFAVGDIPITAMAVGDVPITAAYVGDVQVFSLDTGPPPFDGPLSIPWDIVLWANQEITYPPDGSQISSYPSLGIYSPTQPNWATQQFGPNFEHNWVNGKPVFHLGANQTFYCDYAPANHVGPLTQIVIGQQLGGNNQVIANGPVYLSTWTLGRWDTGNGTSATGMADSNRHMFDLRGGGPASFKVDTVVTASGNPGTSSNARFFLGTGSTSNNVKVAFAAVITRYLTAEEEANMHAWSQSYYGTP